MLIRQLIKLKNYEPITAKFIQNPKCDNIRSVKSYLNGILIASQFNFIHRNINGSFYIGRYGNITLSQAKLFDAAISQQMALNDYVTSFDGKF